MEQLVEHRSCKAKVVGAKPTGGFSYEEIPMIIQKTTLIGIGILIFIYIIIAVASKIAKRRTGS